MCVIVQQSHQNPFRRVFWTNLSSVNQCLAIIITAFQVPSQGFPGGSAGKESTCNAGDLDSIPGLGRSPGEGKGYPLQYSGLENYTDCIVHGVAKSRAPLSDFHSQVPSQAQLGLKWEQVPGAAGWSLRLRSDKCLPPG